MEKQQIFEKLMILIRSINSNSEITENLGLLGDAIFDSLEFMNYVTKVEESFNIVISDSEITNKKLGIVGNMVDHIYSKIQ